MEPQPLAGRDTNDAPTAHNAATESSTSSSTVRVEQLVRSSQEYAAAFDMEVWKAQERKLFEEALAVEKRDRMRALDVEYATKDVARLEEVDTLRRELEMMAKRLDSSGRALAKRIQQQERREEAFEERRLQLARETETLVREMEARHRRALEERDVKVDSLGAQLRERELVWQQTQQRLVATQQEYDSLQRVVSRIQSRESAEATALVELRRRCEALTEQLRETQVRLEERDLAASRAIEEKASLSTACHELQKQLAHTTKAYQALHDAVHREREHFFAQEREKLVQLTRRAEQQQQQGRALAADVLYGYTTATFREAPNGAAPPNGFHGVATPAYTEVQALQQMVATLQREAEASEKERRKAAAVRKEARKHRKTPEPRVFPFAEPIVERPRAAVTQDAGNAAVEGSQRRGRSSSNGTEPSPFRVTGHVGDVLFGHGSNVDASPQGTGDHQGRRTVVDNGVQPTSVKPRDLESHRANSSSVQVPQKQFNSVARDDGDDANVSLSALSTPRSGRSEERDEDETRHSGRGGFVSGGSATLLSSAPSASHVATAGGAAPTALTSLNTSAESAVYSYVALPASLDEDFVNSRVVVGGSTSSSHGNSVPSSAAPWDDRTTHAATTTATLGELTDFVTRLRENRDRLLSTGCYTAKDPLIEDMDAKIRVYERYLRVHEVVM